MCFAVKYGSLNNCQKIGMKERISSTCLILSSPLRWMIYDDLQIVDVRSLLASFRSICGSNWAEAGNWGAGVTE